MLEEIILKGKPKDIGRTHGERLKKEIEKTFSYYLKLWDLTPIKVSKAVQGYKRSIKNAFPHLAEEIEGIAYGASLHPDYIYAINCRTELMSQISINECTSIGIHSHIKINENVILGQNWDWMNYFKEVTKVVDIIPKNKPRVKMLIEPGMVGKIGMNESGLGVCLNYLTTYEAKTSGIPVHVMLRSILECENYMTGLQKICSVNRAANANYLLGDIHNNIGSIETSNNPYRVNIITDKDFVTHTNSFNALGETCARQEKFKKALHGYLHQELHGKITPQALKESFRVPGVEFPEIINGNGIETIHTIIMNLTKGRFLISESSANEFKIYTFD